MRSLIAKQLTLAGEDFGNEAAGTTGDILVYLRDHADNILLASGIDVPINTSSGYAKGCIFLDRNVATGLTGLYENIGTITSCVFNAIGAITADEIALAYGSVLVGDASGDAVALDGSTTTQILIGNGTTMTSVALSQDVTLTNAGVATIATINNLATAAEVNAACDISERLVALTATTAITTLLHEGRDLYVTGTGAAAYTLPEATGSGARFRFIIGEVNTNGTTIVVADTTNANFIGNVINQDLDLVGTIAALIYLAGANADTITLNGTSTGGQKGDYIELIDVATDVWFVNGVVTCPAASNTATCFSAAA
jgi:hypothetical protein